jgi:hypothetical protein
MDELDAAAEFGDDVRGLCRHYEDRGWEVAASGPIARVFIDRQAG